MPYSVMLDAGHGGYQLCRKDEKSIYPSKDDNDKYELVTDVIYNETIYLVKFFKRTKERPIYEDKSFVSFAINCSCVCSVGFGCGFKHSISRFVIYS